MKTLPYCEFDSIYNLIDFVNFDRDKGTCNLPCEKTTDSNCMPT